MYMSLSGRREEEDAPGRDRNKCKSTKIFQLDFKLREGDSAPGFITFASLALSTLPHKNKSSIHSEYMRK